MMHADLEVHLYGNVAATLSYLGPLAYKLTYRREWQQGGGIAISHSLPLAQTIHTGRVVSDFLDNLLPDASSVREEWARQSGLPDAEPYGLLAVHGADVAGALELYPVKAGARTDGHLTPVPDEQIAARILAIRENRPIPTVTGSGPGQFSLGGAQGKFALAKGEGGWNEPSGIHPSTHIFKPQVVGLVDAELVEHVIMSSLPLLGLAAAPTTISTFAGEHALKVERYDRYTADGVVGRIHQEDLAQALGVPRLQKYEKDGGPNYRRILRLLGRVTNQEDAEATKQRFVRSLIFSWFMLNTDAHAKNYSLMLLPERSLLAPLYDVSSFLPYVKPREIGSRGMLEAFNGTKLSMRIADSYEAGSMTAFEWRSVAREAKIDADATLVWAAGMVSAAPGIVQSIAAGLPSQFQTTAVELLVERVAIRSEQIARVLAFESRL